MDRYGGANPVKGGSLQRGQILQKTDHRSGVDPRKGGLPQRGRSYEGLVQREAACPFASILLRALLATMIQFV